MAGFHEIFCVGTLGHQPNEQTAGDRAGRPSLRPLKSGESWGRVNLRDTFPADAATFNFAAALIGWGCAGVRILHTDRAASLETFAIPCPWPGS